MTDEEQKTSAPQVVEIPVLPLRDVVVILIWLFLYLWVERNQ